MRRESRWAKWVDGQRRSMGKKTSKGKSKNVDSQEQNLDGHKQNLDR